MTWDKASLKYSSSTLLGGAHGSINMERDHQLEHFYNRDTFDNQKRFGRDIYDAFKNRNLTHVLAIAPTQSGKTGSILRYRKRIQPVQTRIVPIDNIFIFTGHSSTEWTTQTSKDSHDL